MQKAYPFLLLGLGIYLCQQGSDLALLHTGMNVQDGLVAGTEEGLVLKEVQEVQLGIKVCDSWNWQVPTTEDEAWRNFILVNATQPQAQILTALCCLDFIVISVDGCDCDRNPASMQQPSSKTIKLNGKQSNADNKSCQSEHTLFLLTVTAQSARNMVI